MRAPALLLLLASLPASFPATTLSCFSFNLLDIPSFGFSSSEDAASDKSDMSEGPEPESRDLVGTFDACFWGLLSFVVFSVVPNTLRSEVAKVQQRIFSVPASLEASQEASLGQQGLPGLPPFPDYTQTQMDDGNRRLDLNVYNYVDTSGPSNDISLSPPPSMFTPPPSQYAPQPPSQYAPQYPSQNAPQYPSQYAPQPPSQFASPPSSFYVHSSSYSVGPSSNSSPLPSSYSSYSSSSYSSPLSSQLQGDWEGKLQLGTRPAGALGANTLGAVQPVGNTVGGVRPVGNTVGGVQPVGNTVGGVRPVALQDYDDIDYTSGGLVTFHTSLS